MEPYRTEEYKDVTKDPLSWEEKRKIIGQSLRLGRFRTWLLNRWGQLWMRLDDDFERQTLARKLIIQDDQLLSEYRESKGLMTSGTTASQRKAEAFDVSDVPLPEPDPLYGEPLVYDEHKPTLRVLKGFQFGTPTQSYSTLVKACDDGGKPRREILVESVKLEDFNQCVEQVREKQEVTSLRAQIFDDVARRETSVDLFRTQEAAEAWTRNSPLAKAALKAMSYYALGSGMRILCPNVDVQAYLEELWEYNDFPNQIKKLFRAYYRTGELFQLHFPRTADGMDSIRWVAPRQITTIFTFKDDIHFPLVYRRDRASVILEKPRFYPDVWYEENIQREPDEEIIRIDGKPFSWEDAGKENGFMQFFACGEMGSLRGEVPLGTTLKYFRYAEDLAIAFTTLARERSRVIGKRRINPASKEARAAASTVQRFPAQGYFITDIMGQLEHEFQALNMPGAEARQMFDVVMAFIAAGAQTPPSILTQDPEKSIYHSVLASRNPFLQQVEDMQQSFGLGIAGTMKAAVKFAVRNGKLPKKSTIPKYSQQQYVRGVEAAIQTMRKLGHPAYDRNHLVEKVKEQMGEPEETIEVDTVKVPVTADYPALLTEDPLQKAQVVEKYFNMRMASWETLSEMSGFDPKTEKPKIEQEDAERRQKDQDALDVFNRNQGLFPDEDEDDQT